MPDTRECLKRCLAVVFPALSQDELSRASHTSVANWDSMATVTLVSLVEEEFGVTVAPEDYEAMISFELILEYLEHKMANV